MTQQKQLLQSVKTFKIVALILGNGGLKSTVAYGVFTQLIAINCNNSYGSNIAVVRCCFYFCFCFASLAKFSLISLVAD